MAATNTDGLTLDGLDIYFNGVRVASLEVNGSEELAGKELNNAIRALGILGEMIDEGFMPEGSDFELEAYALLGRDLTDILPDCSCRTATDNHLDECDRAIALKKANP